MNRHDRRKAASQERRGQDTMGTGYTVLPDVPESIKGSPAYKEGQRRAATGEGLSPEYFAATEDAARRIREWLAREPGAELRWLEWDNNRTFIAAALDVGAAYLADSDDARRLLAWLDAETGHVLSLNMAGWALRLVGQIPMPAERP